jgi:hypothetical protein
VSSQAIIGYGSKLSCTSDGSNYFTLAQLQRVVPAGSKQTMIDRTNLLTPDNFDRPLPVLVTSGEIEIDGVLSPQNGSQLSLGQLHATMAVVPWKLLLADGVTLYSFNAAVSEYIPFEIEVAKFVPFKAKLRVVGAMNGPLGSASA